MSIPIRTNGSRIYTYNSLLCLSIVLQKAKSAPCFHHPQHSPKFCVSLFLFTFRLGTKILWKNWVCRILWDMCEDITYHAGILQIIVQGWVVLCRSRTVFTRTARMMLGGVAAGCDFLSAAASSPEASLTGKCCWVMALSRGAAWLKQLNQGCPNVSPCYHTSHIKARVLITSHLAAVCPWHHA